MTEVIELEEHHSSNDSTQDNVQSSKDLSSNTPNENQATWKIYHLLLGTFAKFLVNTGRRFGYTYSPALCR